MVRSASLTRSSSVDGRLARLNLWVAGKNVARLFFGDMGTGLSPFPYALIFPQDEHERLLIDRLAKLGVEVERRDGTPGLRGGERSCARALETAGWIFGGV